MPHDVFLSHSHADHHVATTSVEAIQAGRARVPFDVDLR